MKKISVLIPCFNEVENVEGISSAIENVMKKDLSNYDYEIVFIDNASTDGTRDKIEKICEGNNKIKAIFNVTNFGQFNSPFHGMCSLDGDCVIPVCADFQDPVELIPVFVKKWEEGHKIVSGVKSSSKENGLIYFLRTVYYKTIKNISSVQMIEHFTGFGLYDKTFITLLRQLNDPIPFIRGIVAEYGAGFNMTTVEYEQPKRRAGKTHNNFYTLYDAAMLSITSYTKVGLRLCTIAGFACAIIDMIVAFVYLVLKLTHWYSFHAGYAPMIIGMFLIGAIQLFFIGLTGEYILNINTRVIGRQLNLVQDETTIGDTEQEPITIENLASAAVEAYETGNKRTSTINFKIAQFGDIGEDNELYYGISSDDVTIYPGATVQLEVVPPHNKQNESGYHEGNYKYFIDKVPCCGKIDKTEVSQGQVLRLDNAKPGDKLYVYEVKTEEDTNNHTVVKCKSFTLTQSIIKYPSDVVIRIVAGDGVINAPKNAFAVVNFNDELDVIVKPKNITDIVKEVALTPERTGVDEDITNSLSIISNTDGSYKFTVENVVENCTINIKLGPETE